MARYDFIFGNQRDIAKDTAGNIILVGTPTHVLIPIQPIPDFIASTYANEVTFKIVVDGVEYEHIVNLSTEEQTFQHDAVRVAVNAYGGYLYCSIKFNAYTVHKNTKESTISVYARINDTDGYTTSMPHSRITVVPYANSIRYVYCCDREWIYLGETHIDTETTTGYYDDTGVEYNSEDLVCSGGGGTEPDDCEITIIPETATINLMLTDTVDFNAVASDGSAITWESSMPTVATVDNNGTVTAHAVGLSTISAKSFSCGSANASLNVSLDGAGLPNTVLITCEAGYTYGTDFSSGTSTGTPLDPIIYSGNGGQYMPVNISSIKSIDGGKTWTMYTDIEDDSSDPDYPTYVNITKKGLLGTYEYGEYKINVSVYDATAAMFE